MNEIWHRFDDRRYSDFDEDGDPTGYYEDRISHTQYTVLKHTPKGVWLDLGFGSKRFVLHSSRRRFACATIKEALESFAARKQKQRDIYSERAKRAQKMHTRALVALTYLSKNPDATDDQLNNAFSLLY